MSKNEYTHSRCVLFNLCTKIVQ